MPGGKLIKSSAFEINIAPKYHSNEYGNVPPETVKSIVPLEELKQETFVGITPIDNASGSVISKVLNVVQFESSVTSTI